MILSNVFNVFSSVFKHKTINSVTYSSFMSRYLSIIIDIFSLYTLLQIVPFIFGKFSKYFVPTIETIERYKLNMSMTTAEISQVKLFLTMTFVTHAVEMVVIYIYCMMFWMYLGGTPAKLVMGMRLVDEKTMQFIGFKQANKRFFAYALSLSPLGMGIFWGAFNKKTQMLHDRVSGTIMVNKEAMTSDPFTMMLGRVTSYLKKLISSEKPV